MNVARTTSPEETRELGRRLVERLGSEAVLLLHGDLGSGKTVLAQGLASAIGLAPEQVQSPSYTLICEHEGPSGRLVHVDLYRLDPGDLPALGLEEVLAGTGLKVVEWAERIDFPVEGAWTVRITRGSRVGEREFEIEEPRRNGGSQR